MKYAYYIKKFWPVYLITGVLCILLTAGMDQAVTTIAENIPVPRNHTVVIDAGHGGEDGGATSCTGILESQLNLEIALRLDDLMHLLGHATKMIRRSNISVYTEGETIAAKKVSDLKQRVKIANETQNALLISIHQNYFADGRYAGAQVFYSNHNESKPLSELVQKGFAITGSTRNVKPAKGVYLMEHVDCPAILVECGFLSNNAEEAKLRTPEYQKLLAAIIAASVNRYLNT
jgi:N-acetylmuramoyl-L-alanine amidase